MFALARRAITDPKGEIDKQNIDAEKSDDRPGADQGKPNPDRHADGDEDAHDQYEAEWRKAPVRCQHCFEQNIGFAHWYAPFPDRNYRRDDRRGAHARKDRHGTVLTSRPAPIRLREVMTRPMKKTDIDTMFQRLSDADPDPRGELHYVNAYTLLVAVVLSAQATDIGVNRATGPLFAEVDTPEKMVELGVDRLKEFIKTIGLFNSKAKNVIALSEILIRDHGSQIPRDRETLETLPGVGRKTANVVLNIAFGQPTIAVDTHLFRVGNRTGLARGKTPLAVELELERRIPANWKLHAHHWLILHGRYVCKARKPDCPECRIADLCRFKDKTTLSA